MYADGFLFFSIDNGPRIAVPFDAPGGRFSIDVWYGGDDASDVDPRRGCHIDCELTQLNPDHEPADHEALPGHS